MIRVIRTKNYEELSDRAFEIVRELLKTKPDAVLGLATGSTPLGLYERMVQDHRENGTSYREVETFNLDEYVGLPEEHPESYHSFMDRNLFSQLDIKKENTHVPSGHGDLQQNCQQYNDMLAEKQIDLQILGIGSNGHIGFNEPGTSFDSQTHVVRLKQSTIEDNARFFDHDVNKVPTEAITMGISNVMAASRILLLASGAGKANAIQATVMGRISETVPASVLQTHDDVIIIVDAEAAGSLYKEKR